MKQIRIEGFEAAISSCCGILEACGPCVRERDEFGDPWRKIYADETDEATKRLVLLQLQGLFGSWAGVVLTDKRGGSAEEFFDTWDVPGFRKQKTVLGRSHTSGNKLVHMMYIREAEEL